jgi:hypothetical protein
MKNINDFGLKYYAFDWDDNILKMPTMVYLKTKDGRVVGMPTYEYSFKKSIIGKRQFKFNGNLIVGYDDEPFRDFLQGGDDRFILDIKKAKIASSDIWKDFVEAINNGSIFSIITARGHNPETIKNGIKNLIDISYEGIDRDKLINNLIGYHIITNSKFNNDYDWLITDYLNKCRFYPITYLHGTMSDPSEGKVKAMNDFLNYIEEQSKKVRVSLVSYVNLDFNIKPSIGFSDDDIDNVNLIRDKIFREDFNISIYHTKNGKKVKIDLAKAN